MHDTQHMLDADYKPVTATEVCLSTEIQIFMYTVFKYKLKAEKDKSLVSH
jgi:hypothetical protein